MLAARLALAALLSATLGKGATPNYSAASVVNSATGLAGDFAPNSMVTIYGSALAYSTAAASAGQPTLPRILAGVQVSIGGQPADLFYVSPQQINFLIPVTLLAGPAKLYVSREGLAGPVLTLTLRDTAPGFFPLDGGVVIATHADGRLITDGDSALPEEIVVIYAAGLGRTNPDVDAGRASTRAAPILLLSQLAVLLGGAKVDPDRILYAGITPGYAGLYQINLKIPPGISPNPEIRVFIGAQSSPSFLKLPLRIQ